jgi:hypothetical protein
VAKLKVSDKLLDDIAMKIFVWFGQCGDEYELKFRDLYEVLARTGELIKSAEQGGNKDG